MDRPNCPHCQGRLHFVCYGVRMGDGVRFKLLKCDECFEVVKIEVSDGKQSETEEDPSGLLRVVPS